MLEPEWLTSTDPQRMLAWMRKPRGPFLGASTGDPRRSNVEVSDRKLRLFACACCRQIWHLLTDERSRQAVEVAERFADGLATRDELFEGGHAGTGVCSFNNDVASGTAENCRFRHGQPPTLQAALLRDIAGNPWRQDWFGEGWWLTHAIIDMARTIYADRDFTALPILADALEDVGCNNADILTHLRGPGPHVRGCHVLDLLLGKD